MSKPRIIFDFLRASNAKLETQGGTIIAAMTNNPYFTSPMPALGEVNTAQQQYAAALYASQSGDKNHIEQRKDARKKLEVELTRLANYVMAIAGESRAIMVSSGFTVSAETRNANALGVIENFAVALGKNSGEVDLSVNPVKFKKSYLYYYAVAGTDPIVWNFEHSGDPNFTIKGLLPLVTYLFKIKAVGKKQESVETEVITKVVL